MGERNWRKFWGRRRRFAHGRHELQDGQALFWAGVANDGVRATVESMFAVFSCDIATRSGTPSGEAFGDVVVRYHTHPRVGWWRHIIFYMPYIFVLSCGAEFFSEGEGRQLRQVCVVLHSLPGELLSPGVCG